jgi:Methane oxygenase PmoA
MCEELRRRLVMILVFWALYALAACPPTRADTWRVSLQGGEVGPSEYPLVAELKALVPPGFYFLEPADGSDAITAHVFLESERRFLAAILPRAEADRPAKYRLERKNVQDRDFARGIWLRDQKGMLNVDFDQGMFAMYHTKSGNKPFLFPLIGPNRQPYTRTYPMAKIPGEDEDHPHQRSFWFTHGNVNGVDFWGEGPTSGRIEEFARTVVVEGPVLARLVTKNAWRTPAGQSVCDDERIMTFYRTFDARVLDFEVKIAANSGPVEFRDTKEGMFGIRVASSMDVDKKSGGKITNAEGLADQAAWGQASSWVDYVGPVSDKTVGIAVLNHPSSFRYPTTWHVRTYGLFAANPFGWHDFGKSEKGDYTIPAGQSITFRYRVILHEGDTKSAAVAGRFAAYTNPPSVVLEQE